MAKKRYTEGIRYIVKYLKWFFSEYNIRIFGAIYVLLILFFFDPSRDYCDALTNMLSTVMELNSYCELDGDCSIFEPVLEDCMMPGACGISLNSLVNTRYFNYFKIQYMKKGCTVSCTPICIEYSNLVPECINNICDFSLP